MGVQTLLPVYVGAGFYFRVVCRWKHFDILNCICYVPDHAKYVWFVIATGRYSAIFNVVTFEATYVCHVCISGKVQICEQRAVV